MRDLRNDAILRTSDLGDAAAIRAAADGELHPDDARALDASADARARIGFEHGLRSAVARAMTGPSAPAGLRERVAQAVARQAESEDRALAERMDLRAAQTRHPSFWQRHGRLVGGLAAAAGLALVAGVYLVSVTGSLPGAGTGATATSYTTRLAGFVAGEHQRVSADASAAARKFVLDEVDQARVALRDAFGTEVAVPECDTVGVAFRGCGPCHVPGSSLSRHMQFVLPAKAEGDQDRLVSLFVSSGGDDLGLEPGVTYRLDTAACGVPDARIYLWTAGGLTYCLVTDGDPEGKACDRLLEVMSLPAPTQSL